MLHVGVCCAVVSVPCSIVVTSWERTYLITVVFVVFCYFANYVLVHIITKGEVGTLKQCLSHPVEYFTDRSKAVLLLLIINVICALCLSCFRVCSLLPCGHLL